MKHSRLEATKEILTPTLKLKQSTTTALKKGTSTLKLVSKIVIVQPVHLVVQPVVQTVDCGSAWTACSALSSKAEEVQPDLGL